MSMQNITIDFTHQQICNAKLFGDVEISKNKAGIVKRSFAQWIVHCLKYFGPFKKYRKQIIDDRRVALEQLLENNKGFSARTESELLYTPVGLGSDEIFVPGRWKRSKKPVSIAKLAENRKAYFKAVKSILSKQQKQQETDAVLQKILRRKTPSSKRLI